MLFFCFIAKSEVIDLKIIPTFILHVVCTHCLVFVVVADFIEIVVVGGGISVAVVDVVVIVGGGVGVAAAGVVAVIVVVTVSNSHFHHKSRIMYGFWMMHWFADEKNLERKCHSQCVSRVSF